MSRERRRQAAKIVLEKIKEKKKSVAAVAVKIVTYLGRQG